MACLIRNRVVPLGEGLTWSCFLWSASDSGKGYRGALGNWYASQAMLGIVLAKKIRVGFRSKGRRASKPGFAVREIFAWEDVGTTSLVTRRTAEEVSLFLASYCVVAEDRESAVVDAAYRERGDEIRRLHRSALDPWN
jgi:hypothetical protein